MTFNQIKTEQSGHNRQRKNFKTTAKQQPPRKRNKPTLNTMYQYNTSVAQEQSQTVYMTTEYFCIVNQNPRRKTTHKKVTETGENNRSTVTHDQRPTPSYSTPVRAWVGARTAVSVHAGIVAHTKYP